jgi:surface protein
MYRMFYQAYAFNQHLSRWDVSSVTTMREMFYIRQRIQQDAGGLGHIQSHGFS